MYQPKDGDGSLFKNRKQKEAHPDVRGSFLLEGKEYEIAGWQKSTRAGDPWWSLKIQPKRQQQRQQPPAENRSQTDGGFDSDVPF